MACEETGCYVSQIPQPFVWTEDAHCLYLSFLEDAFVNDLYHRHYCSLDICGSSPPFTAHTPPSSIAADSPSSAPPPPPPPPPSKSQPSQPMYITDSKACHRRSCIEARSTKRKGKWLSHDVGLDNQLVLEPSIRSGRNMSSLKQAGSSSQPFENSERVVPRGPRRGLKRSRVKGVDLKLCDIELQETDQVVPSVCEEG